MNIPNSNTPNLSARDTNLENVVAEKQTVLHPEQSIQQAGDKMRELNTDALAVAEEGRLVGMVDQENPDRRAAGYGHDPNATTVRDLMNSDVLYCFEEDVCAQALRKMDARCLDRLPLVDRQMRIVGFVRREDLTEPRSDEGVRSRAAGEKLPPSAEK